MCHKLRNKSQCVDGIHTLLLVIKVENLHRKDKMYEVRKSSWYHVICFSRLGRLHNWHTDFQRF